MPAEEFQKPTKKSSKKILIILTLLVLMLVSASAGYLYVYRKNSTANDSVFTDGNTLPIAQKPTATKIEPPKPVFLPSPINGVMYEDKNLDALMKRPVLAVIVQNHTAARPQWGINEADVIYEALAEGGITRFMGIYWSKDTEKIMSIRSARKYFVDTLGDYANPVFMHIGYADGADNVSALGAIKKYGLRSFDLQGPNSFFRDQACQRIKASEHCAFTDTKTLWANAQKNNWQQDVSKVEKLLYKDKKNVDDSAKQLIDFTVDFGSLESFLYSTRWKYVAEKNNYVRFNPNGTPYPDGTGNSIISDVVIYQKITSVPANDSKNHIIQDVIGSGTGYIMQDGKVYPITWKKQNYATRTRYFDSLTGKEFVLNRGKMWIMQVPKQFEFKDNAPQVTATPSPV